MTYRTLAKLTHLARDRDSGLPELVEACSSLARQFKARSAFVLYSSGEEGQRQIGISEQAVASPLSPEAFGQIVRPLLKGNLPVAFDLIGGKVMRLVVARSGVRRSHLAAHLPIHQRSADVLIVEGMRNPITSDDIALVDLASLLLSHLAKNVVDADYSHRKREQLNALTDIARVMAKDASKEELLVDLARACAAVSGFDAVQMVRFDEVTEEVAYRARSGGRFGDHNLAAAFEAGLFDRPLIAVGKRRRPMLLSDLARDRDDAITENQQRALKEGLNFSSVAVVPLITRDEVIGAMSFCSFTAHDFGEEECAVLNGLCSQVALIVKGMDLYDELRTSKEKLEEYSERLHESVSVEHRIARTDVLTGLPNRRYLEEAMAGESAVLAADRQLCLLLVDVDQFKMFNDRFGHSFGDDLLKLVATVGRNMCGPGDIVGRFGGDEFLFLLLGGTLWSAASFAEDFRKQVEVSQLRTRDGEVMKVSVSVGVAGVTPGCECTAEEILERADRGMYRAKFAGGNCVAVCEDPPLEALEANVTSQDVAKSFV